MMEIGLYNAKYPFRKMIRFLLGFCKNTNPNVISLFLLPLGFITACLYFFAIYSYPLYLIGVGFIFLRMIIGTLDGMVAETFDKSTANGSILNRLTPEIADMLLMLAIILSHPEAWLLGIMTLTVCWGISFTGLVPLVGGKKIKSMGPVGQTDRLIALILFSCLQYASVKNEWQWDFMRLFLWWTLLGGLLTTLLRCYQTFTQSE